MRPRSLVLAMAVVGLVTVTVGALSLGLTQAAGDPPWTPIAHVVQPRTGGALVALPDGRAVLLGGVTSTGSGGEVARIIELWRSRDETGPIDDREDPRYPWSPIGFQGFGFATSAVAIDQDLILIVDDSTSLAIGTWLLEVGDGYDRDTRVTSVQPAALAPGRGPQDEIRPPVLVSTGPRQAVLVGSPEHGVQRFDATGPAAGAWTPTQPMNHARTQMAVAALPDGRVLAAGGLVPAMAETPGFVPQGDDATDTMLTLRTAEIRDPETGAWTDVATMPYPVREALAVALRDGRVLLANGFSENPRTSQTIPADPLLYDPQADSWTVLPAPPVVGYEARLVALDDGGAMLIGGSLRDDPDPGAYRWDPVTGQWSTTPSMTVVREDHGAAILDDGRVLVAGGRNAQGFDTPTAELWVPPATPTPDPTATPAPS